MRSLAPLLICFVLVATSAKMVQSHQGAFDQLFSDFQAVGVEHMVPTEEWERLKDEVKSLPAAVKETVVSIPLVARQWLVSEWEEDSAKVQEAWKIAQAGVHDSLTTIKQHVDAWKARLHEQLHDLSQKVPKDKKEAWEKAHSTITNTIDSIESAVRAEIKEVDEKWQKLSQHTEHSLHHAEHHPVLRCGGCGTQYTLQEFLRLSRVRGGLFIREEEWWSDEELDEFYEGWPEWANRSSVHCPSCDAVAWKGPAFQQHVHLDAHTHAHPDSKQAEHAPAHTEPPKRKDEL